ncbi:MAG: hypothetical protein JO115_11610 [Pseudonocardiales bacterium]|nr:hypothetical protein [Pseudonocardiales bacterium]
MTREEDQRSESVTVEQVGAALAALGLYDGSNTSSEHTAEAARLGGTDAYRVRMVNALLGAVQTQAMLADAVGLDEEARHAARREQLTSAGAFDDPAVRVGFIRWQVLRAGIPLRLIAQNPETGPIPVAAAHAAEGLHVLLGVIGSSYQAVAAGDVETLAAQAGLLRAARDSLQTAIDNTDILLHMLKSVGIRGITLVAPQRPRTLGTHPRTTSGWDGHLGAEARHDDRWDL